MNLEQWRIHKNFQDQYKLEIREFYALLVSIFFFVKR